MPEYVLKNYSVSSKINLVRTTSNVSESYSTLKKGERRGLLPDKIVMYMTHNLFQQK